MLPRLNPFEFFTETDGSPLDGGKVYIGTVNQNPKTSPITVYFDSAMTIPAPQPLQTVGGRIVKNGAAASIYSNASSFSLLVENKSGQQVSYSASVESDPANVLLDLSQSSGSSLVGFIQSGSGAVDRTVQSKLREFVSAKDFGAIGDGVTDDTAALQVAINQTSTTGSVLYIPSGTYLVTETLSIPNKTQIIGEHRHQYIGAAGTNITFAPTSPKSLFVPSGAVAPFRWGYALENLYINGNSASAIGNSIYAIDCHGWNKSVVRNVAIQNFRTGVRCYATINNRFEFIQIQNCYIQNILYDGGVSTTDVWEQPYIGNSPIGVQTNSTNVAIRFNKPIFEGITTYGMNLVRECYGWLVTDGYSEDAPNANVATNAMFRVGYDGAALGGGLQLIIRGGFYGGRNAGGVGSFIDVDFTDGVIVGGMFVTRFTNGIKTTSNTQTNQVVSSGWTAASVSNIVTDSTKVSGDYPQGVFNSGTRNMQTSRRLSLDAIGTVTVRSGASAGSSTELVIGNGTATTVGAAGGASALPATPLGYLTAYIGATQVKIPYYTA